MIVKNESECILDCLASVKDKIDYWVIFDTGSNDGTQKLIRNFMKDVPGELHESPWVDFAHNRNEVFNIAKNKADYSLFIDADEKLMFLDESLFSKLDKDCYMFVVREPTGFDYHRMGLVNNRLDWKWVGAVHEAIVCEYIKSHEILSGVVNLSDTRKGNRSKDPHKYLKDALVLEKALEKEPNNWRYRYYLGQSYFNAGCPELALKNYEIRSKMGGSEEEVYHSMFCIARLQEILKKPSNLVISSYLEAYRYRPSRAEPLFYLAKYYIGRQDYKKAYGALKFAAPIPISKDGLFVETWIYDWGVLYHLAECCSYLSKHSELNQLIERLLCKPLTTPCMETVKKVKADMQSSEKQVSSLSLK